jgi:hypothetical protein
MKGGGVIDYPRFNLIINRLASPDDYGRTE